MTTRIYYVGIRISWKSRRALARFYGIDGSKLHSTLMYSKQWFPYRPSELLDAVELHPPFTLEQFGKLTVLRYNNDFVNMRHAELCTAGGVWEYADFKSHITLGELLDETRLFDYPITCVAEYYRTWEQEP